MASGELLEWSCESYRDTGVDEHQICLILSDEECDGGNRVDSLVESNEQFDCDFSLLNTELCPQNWDE